MIAFIGRRVLSTIPTLVGISVLTFVILNLVPSDPLLTWTPPGAVHSAEALEYLRSRLPADRGSVEGYLDWVTALLSGNLGRSLRDGRPVGEVIGEAVPWTMLLNLCAVLLVYGLAVPFGYAGASAPGSLTDRLGGWVLLTLYALPSFAAALVLQELFSVHLQILPLQGTGGGEPARTALAGAFDLFRHLVLPSICLALSGWAFVARYSREVFRSVMGLEYLVMARAKGLPRSRAAIHVLAGSAIPFVSLLAAILPGLVGGSVIVEEIFSWPGLGRLYLTSVQARDYSVVMGLTLMSAVAVLAGQFVVDMLYLVVDPRIRDRFVTEGKNV